MPTLSDPPYPFNCLPKGLASTFERYQIIREMSGWLSHEEAEELRKSVQVFGNK